MTPTFFLVRKLCIFCFLQGTLPITYLACLKNNIKTTPFHSLHFLTNLEKTIGEMVWNT